MQVARIGQKRTQIFWFETLEERDRFGDPGADRITSIKQDFKETGRKGVGWIHRAQGRDQWQALINKVTSCYRHAKLM